jgi:hypothetical protein
VTERRSGNHIAMGHGEALRQTDQAASRLARQGGHGLVDLGVVAHRSERHYYPE